MWGLGTSSLNVDDATYTWIHVDFPVAFVKQWLAARTDAPMSFHYVTGMGTDANGSEHWAREKGRAELEVAAMAEGTGLRTFGYRSAYIRPAADRVHAGHKFLAAILRPGALVIDGEDLGNAMLEISARSDELANVLREVERNRWAERILFLGKVDNETLAQCYAGADCLLFPLVPVAGDVEGFGMVAIEAAAHGTPTVAFAEGGVVDAVAAGSSGFLVDSGDYQAMVQVLADIHYSEDDRVACREFASRFSWDIFGDKFLAHLERVVSKG